MNQVPPTDETLTCVECQAAFLYSAYERGKFGRLVKPLCQRCRDERAAAAAATVDQADVTLACRDCGAAFTLTKAEQQFFIDRQLHQPRRCKACRQAARSARW